MVELTSRNDQDIIAPEGRAQQVRTGVGKRPTLATLLMVKNEKKRIHVSIASAGLCTDAFIIFDTGSTDETIPIIEKYCKQHRKKLHIKRGDFVDFSTSRNVMLDFADTFDYDWHLLLDCNDELRGPTKLWEFMIDHNNSPEPGYHTRQEWHCPAVNSYYNCRLIRGRRGWHYNGVVHEWLSTSQGQATTKLPPEVHLYQDRTADDDKTSKRFTRDRELLLKEYLKCKGQDSRTVFYLAQTYECLGDCRRAYKYFCQRAEQNGFYEETYEAMLRAGRYGDGMGRPWEECQQWYWRAWILAHRAEPLIKLAEHYADKDWASCWLFARTACELNYPDSAILFVDADTYNYVRWHYLAASAHHMGKKEEGRHACEQALKARPSSSVEQEFLRVFYN